MADVATQGSNFEVAYQADAKLIIGDENSASFKPNVRVCRWGEETYAAFGLPTSANVAPTFDGSVVTWTDQGTDTRCRFYPVDHPKAEDGGFEFDILLGSMPASPVITLSFESQGLDFYYQPALTDFEQKVLHANRPVDVVGSYAAYHSSKKHNQYKTGKAFHLFRPLAVDAKGQAAYGDLQLEEGLLHLIFDPDWLATAVYPVLIDPTIGYTSIGGSDSDTGDYMLSNQFTASGSGDANTGTAYVGGYAASGTKVMMVGVYHDSGGSDCIGEAKLHTSPAQITQTTTTGGWHSASITWTGITDATKYWLAANAQSGGHNYYDSGGTLTYAPRVHSNDMPATFPSDGAGTSGNVISIYIDYTAAGGATVRNMCLLGTGL